MKNLVVIILLQLICINYIIANNDELLYDFTIGDEFDVRVTNKLDKSCFRSKSPTIFSTSIFVYNAFSTSIDVYFTFRSIKKEDSLMVMEAEIKRVARYSDNYLYDTQSGFPIFSKEDKNWKDKVGEIYRFKINKYGLVSSIELKNTPKKQNGKRPTFSTYRKQLKDKKRTKQYEQDIINRLIQNAFPLTLSRDSLMASVELLDLYQEETRRLNNLPLGYLSKVTNKDQVVFKTNYVRSFSERGSMAINRLPREVLVDTLQFSTKLSRIEKGKLKYYANEGQSYFGLFEMEYLEQGWDAKTDSAFISGKIENYQGQKPALYLWKMYSDAELFKTGSLHINADGSFSWAIPLKRPFEITFRLGSYEDGFTAQLFLEPEDRIYLDINQKNKTKPIMFSGASVYKFQQSCLVNEMLNTFKQLTFSEPQQLVDKISSLVNNFEQQICGDSLSFYARKNLMAQLYFGAYSSAIHNILNKNSGAVNLKSWENEIIESIDFETYAFYTSHQMRQIINSLVNKSKYDNRFEEKVTSNIYGNYYLKSAQITTAIKYGKIEEAVYLFEGFAKVYAYTELTDYFTSLLGDVSHLVAGEDVIDFNVIDLNGKHVSLSNYKGKWVYFMFASSGEKLDLDKIKTLEKLRSQIINKNFETILILTNPISNDALKSSVKNIYKGKILLNPNWKYPSTHPYQVSFRHSGFFINPEFKYEDVWYSLPNVLIGEVDIINDFMDLYESKQIAISYKTIYTIVAVFLISLVLCMVIFIYWRKRARKQAEEKRQKTLLELKAIRSQLNPHFIFNSLNSIQNLVSTQKNKEASLYLSEFSILMRNVLNNSEKELVPLEMELDLIAKYLDLEVLRFGFDYKIQVADDVDVYNIEVPTLMLQPLVENAVVHGVSMLGGKGLIVINIAKNNNQLISTIDDNGSGVDSNKIDLSNGHGIALTKKRFRMFQSSFGEEISLAINNKEELGLSETGTIVKLKFNLDEH